ncbi:MAG: hypothetical protein LBG74_01395 [Spirochaetaceae bacterium]|jgi:hypothetical protein|nr:hypothetical protein [Spirochaetaceae bacterium]
MKKAGETTSGSGVLPPPPCSFRVKGFGESNLVIPPPPPVIVKKILFLAVLACTALAAVSCPNGPINPKKQGGEEENKPRLSGLYVLDTSAVPPENPARFNETEDEEDTDAVPPGTLLTLRDSNGNTVEFNPETFIYYVEIPKDPITVTLHGQVDADVEAGYPTGKTLIPQAGTVSLVTAMNSNAALECYQIFYTQAALPQATLSGVLLSMGVLDNPPAFDPAVHTYDVNVDVQNLGAGLIISAQSALSGAIFGYEPAMPLLLDINGSTLKITVTAPDYTPSIYTFNVNLVSSSGASSLADLTLTEGTIAFDPNTTALQTITVPAGTEALTVSAIKTNTGDTVKFLYNIGGQAVETQGTVCQFQKTGGLNGFGFQIYVIGGMTTPVLYDFVIAEAPLTPARLAGISSTAGMGTVTLYQRDAGTGANGSAGFDETVTLYNMNFNNSADNVALTISADAIGADVLINDVPVTLSGGTVTHTVGMPRAKLPPVKITVNKHGFLSTSYWVYFVRGTRFQAALTGITVSGMAGGTALSPSFNGATSGPYTAKVFVNTPAVVITGEYNAAAHPDLTVTYKNLNTGSTSNFLTNLTVGTDVDFEITISEGDPAVDYDYTRKTYTLAISPLAAQTPRLSSLRVNSAAVSPPVTGKTHDTLVYTAALDYSAGTEVPPFAWTTDNEIEAVWYSFNSGVAWHQDANKTGFDAAELSAAGGAAAAWNIGPGQRKTVLIKVRSYDKQEVIYCVTVNKAALASCQLATLDITGTDINWDPAASFVATKTNYAIWLTGAAPAIAAAPVDPDAVVYYKLDGAAPVWTMPVVSLGVDETKTLEIYVSNSSSVTIYTLSFTRYQKVWEYGYLNSQRAWTAPRNSDYKVEVWGGQGGTGVSAGGKGGYSWGIVNALPSGSVMNVYVGDKGANRSDRTGGTGGAIPTPAPGSGGKGGNGSSSSNNNAAGGGGAASEVRFGGTALTDRIIVAGGGGGGGGRNQNDNEKRVGTGGGGEWGDGGDAISSGGTVISGAKWAPAHDGTHTVGQSSGAGQGGFNGDSSTYEGTGGGGGGYYGGNASTSRAVANLAGGAGGSGYVDSSFFSSHGGSGGFTVIGSSATPDAGTGYGNYADLITGAGKITITDVGFTPPSP